MRASRVRSVPVGRAGDDGRQLPRRHAAHHGTCARRFAFHQRRARRLRAVDARSVRRVRQGIAARRAPLGAAGRRAHPGPAGRRRGIRQRHFARHRRRRRCSCRPAAITSRCARKASSPSSPTWCSRPASRARSTSSSSIPKDVVGNSPARITTKSGIKLLIVAGGTYQAGTDRREQGRRPNEGSHKVTLVRPFYMGEREVTNAQFRQFRPTHNSGAIGNVSLDLDKQPVARVTWDDAAEFCNWLSAQEGLPPAYSGGGEGGVSAHRAGDQRLSAAHRGRVGIRRARREHRQAAQVSLGQGPARGVRHAPTSPAARRSRCSARRSTGTRTNSPPWRRRRCSRPMRSASTTSPAMCRSGPTTAIFPSSRPRRSPIRSVPTDSKGHAYRGSNWRSTTTSELRFPWREGGNEATRCHWIPCRALRGARLGPK